MLNRPEEVEAGPVGWTCPVCEHFNLQDNVLCDKCGFERDLDYPMDDELPEDSGPAEP